MGQEVRPREGLRLYISPLSWVVTSRSHQCHAHFLSCQWYQWVLITSVVSDCL